jgi:hypothetical protein
MILWIFLPTLFFVVDTLVYFLFGNTYVVTTMSFVLFSFFNHNASEKVQALGVFYLLLQASIFYGTIIIASVFCIVARYLFARVALFFKDGLLLHSIMTLFCMSCYMVVMSKTGLIQLNNYTIFTFFVIITIILIQSLFLNSIYGASGQSNRLCKARGKSGHQTGNVPFDKIRAGNKYC